MKRNHILSASAWRMTAIAFLLICLLPGCDTQNEVPAPAQESPETPEKIIELPEAQTPETIRLELREGHSHLKKNPEPGELYWSEESGGGFHANPYFSEKESPYPFRTLQIMVLRRQSDGSYAIDADAGTDTFRVQTAPNSGGTWQALLVTFYDKHDKRIDPDFRKPPMSKRTQLFFSVSDMQPIAQTRPQEGISREDTCVQVDYNYMGFSPQTQESIRKITGDGLIPMVYHTTATPYHSSTPADSVFYYFYYDRETDDIDKSPFMHEPLGFRGTIANRVPFVSYLVHIRLTVVPEGSAKPQPYGRKPDTNQLEHTVFHLKIPFRNIMEKYDSHVSFPKEVMQVLEKDPEYQEAAKEGDEQMLLEDMIGDKTAVMGMHIHVLREYPGHTLRELTDWYKKQLRNSNPESSNFWL